MERNSKDTSLLTDHIATVLAANIIRCQARFADCLNRKFNAYSIVRKKTITVVIGLCTSILLVISAFCSYDKLPKLPLNYSGGHIGLPSDRNNINFNKRQLTDSLTIKK